MKAVVKIGGHQYIVAEKETLLVDLFEEGIKELKTKALAIIDGENSVVGTPETDVVMTAKVIEPEVKGEKVQYIRYKAKKRVHKVSGHRPKYSKIEIISIK